MSNDNQYEIYSGQVNQFSSSFWIERKWIFDVEIKFVDIVYIIRPYSKRWYDDTKDNNVNCSIEYSKLPGFTFVHTSGFMFEEMISEKDVQSFLHTIFKNINRNNDYHHLRSLCVHVPTADDRVVERIAYMMKCKKLVHHFTVKLVLDDIYLQGK